MNKTRKLREPFNSNELIRVMGAHNALGANHGIRASIRAMNEVFSSVYTSGGIASVEDKIATLDEVFELQGMPQMKESELKYSLADSASVVAVIPVAGDHLQEHSMKNISEDIPFSMLDINGKPSCNVRWRY